MVKAAERAHEIGATASRSSVTTRRPGGARRAPLRAGGVPRTAAPLRHRAGRRSTPPTCEPRRQHAGLLRPLRRGARPRPGRRARVRGPVRQRPHRLPPRHRAPAGSRRLADGAVPRPRSRGAMDRSATLVLENSAGGGFGIGATVEELAASPSGSPPAGCREARGFASTPPTCGPPATGSRSPMRPTRCSRRSTPDRARPAGDAPPQRLEERVRVAARPS